MESRESSGVDLLDPTESGIVHMVEYDVRRRLLARDDLEFHSLVVRRVPGGICLEGSVARPCAAEIESLLADVDNVGEVHNHLVVQWSGPPPKG